MGADYSKNTENISEVINSSNVADGISKTELIVTCALINVIVTIAILMLKKYINKKLKRSIERHSSRQTTRIETIA